MLSVGTLSSGTYLPVAVGAVIAAVGSLVFIMRSPAFSEEEQAMGHAPARQSAVRRVLVIYAIIAWFCFIGAIAIGDIVFIALTGVVALLASVGLLRLWSIDRG
jgi:hypothetical protein